MCRIYLGYHTVSQTVCGVAVGGVMAGLWFVLVQVKAVGHGLCSLVI